MSTDTPAKTGGVPQRARANEAERRGEVLTNLLSVSSYLTSVLDPEELFSGLTQHVVEVVPAVQAGLLWLYERQQNALRVVSMYGLDFDANRELLMRLRLRPGIGLAGRGSSARRADADRRARALPRDDRPHQPERPRRPAAVPRAAAARADRRAAATAHRQPDHWRARAAEPGAAASAAPP